MSIPENWVEGSDASHWRPSVDINEKERLMQISEKERLKTIIDRNKLMQLKKCVACGKPFNLGDPVVLAHVSRDGSLTLIHENEAVFDKQKAAFVERQLFEAQGNIRLDQDHSRSKCDLIG